MAGAGRPSRPVAGGAHAGAAVGTGTGAAVRRLRPELRLAPCGGHDGIATAGAGHRARQFAGRADPAAACRGGTQRRGAAHRAHAHGHAAAPADTERARPCALHRGAATAMNHQQSLPDLELPVPPRRPVPVPVRVRELPAAEAEPAAARELWAAVQLGTVNARSDDLPDEAYPAALAVLVKRAGAFT